MTETIDISLRQLDPCRYQIPASHRAGMRVPGMIYANEKLLQDILKDKALEQVVNVAFLPGIVGQSLAMPDMHWGYGFPIGGVAATDPEEGGVISPGGVGFDINCGVRFVRTDLTAQEVQPYLKDLVSTLFDDVPSGLGSKSGLRLTQAQEKQVLVKGSQWMVAQGYGTPEDLDATEDHGSIQGTNPQAVSDRAYERGKSQLGTLGSGNHFLEVQVVDQVFLPDLAEELGLFEGQVGIMIHCGSRGFGYQVCDDYCHSIIQCLSKYQIEVPDRQLACAPVESSEGQEYLSAMRCAANYAFANRQYIMHMTRKSFEKIFRKSWESLGINLVYDVAHNIAKMERHRVNGKERLLCVHRKGATRAFPAGHPELPERYQKTGQPVIIPGDMGRFSYLLVGAEGARETFYSCCHGAGRVMSRSKAAKTFKMDQIIKDLEQKGIVLQAQSKATVVEEASGVYKDVTDVVDVVQEAGLSKKLCRIRPVGVIKG